MKRRLFNLLAATSLVLCLVFVGLWVRSHWKFDSLGLQVGDGLPISCNTLDGDIEIFLMSGPTRVGGSGWNCTWEVFERDAPAWMFDKALKNVRRPRYHIGSLGVFIDSRRRIVYLRFWMLVLSLAILPLIDLARTVKRRYRAASGYCVRCGYDLRATPNQCPECGKVQKCRNYKLNRDPKV